MWFYTYFFGSFVGSSLATLCYDLFINRNKLYKREKNETLECVKNIAPNIAFNLIAITAPYSYFLESYIDDKERYDYGLVINFLLYFISADFFNYFVHLAFHKIVYLKYFHLQHHEFIYPIGMSALYGHPIDYFFVNLLPFTAPIYILYPPDYVIKIVLTIALANTVILAHGSYAYLTSHHLLHHKYFNGNYGLGLMDKIMGTDL